MRKERSSEKGLTLGFSARSHLSRVEDWVRCSE